MKLCNFQRPVSEMERKNLQRKIDQTKEQIAKLKEKIRELAEQRKEREKLLRALRISQRGGDSSAVTV
jgi:peptidoglycan hydrolase CwlO-like protein